MKGRIIKKKGTVLSFLILPSKFNYISSITFEQSPYQNNPFSYIYSGIKKEIYSKINYKW